MTAQTSSSLPSSARQHSWVVTRLLKHRGVQLALAVWALAYVVVLLLANGALPFDRPVLDDVPFLVQLASPSVAMLEVFILMAVAVAMTRNRPIPDLAARAPERALARRETFALLGYAALGQVIGWWLGPALGFKPFSFHLAGTLVGGHQQLQVAEMLAWMTYNFVVYAAVPFFYFRRRYSLTQLNLTSTHWGADLRLVAAICVIETLFELTAFSSAIFALSPSQLVVGIPLTFLVYGAGTVLPTMILIYSILVPRYLKLTGSVVSTVLLGGVTYAAMHIVEGWSNFTTPANTVLSLIFVMFTYFGPGMIKTVLTLRTGNAWVHALGYHALAPHVAIDTPHVVGTFGIR